MQTKTKALPPIKLTEAMIIRHQASVWRFLRFLGSTASEADDLMQESFLALLDRPPEDKGDEALGRWLRKVAHNLFRSSHRRIRLELEALAQVEIESIWSENDGCDAGQRYGEALEDCIARLGRREQELLRMHYTQGRARKDIALAMAMSSEGVKTLLRRVKDQLKQCIQKRCDDETA